MVRLFNNLGQAKAQMVAELANSCEAEPVYKVVRFIPGFILGFILKELRQCQDHLGMLTMITAMASHGSGCFLCCPLPPPTHGKWLFPLLPPTASITYLVGVGQQRHM